MSNTIQQIPSVSSINRNSLALSSKRQRNRSIIRDFALNTSIHGLPNIARSQSVHNRIFWSISTVLFTGFMLYLISHAISSYFQYPKQTSIDVIVEWPIPFPAVSFCNYCPVRQDRFLGAFTQYLMDMNIINDTTDTNSSTFLLTYMNHFVGFFQNNINRNESMNDLFFPINSMLISCSFNGIICTSDDFISFSSAAYGACYTFNANMKNQSQGGIRDSNQGGGNGIMSMHLYTHNHLYVPYITDAHGIMLMIHDNTQLPLIDVAGMALGSGQKHKLSFTRKKSYLLPSPYTQCTTRVSPPLQQMFNQYQEADYAYSQLICYTNCIQAYSYHICGCVDPSQWSTRFVALYGTNTIIQAPLCNITNTCYATASDYFMKTASIWTEWCIDCQQECNTTSFGITLSSMSAPPMWMMSSIRAFVENSSMPLPSNWSTAWFSHIESNYIAIDIVRETIQLEKLTQEPSIDRVALLSNVGGLSSIWIGISFLSMMQFIEMLYRLVHSNIHLVHTNIRRTTQVQRFTEDNNNM